MTEFSEHQNCETGTSVEVEHPLHSCPAKFAYLVYLINVKLVKNVNNNTLNVMTMFSLHQNCATGTTVEANGETTVTLD